MKDKQCTSLSVKNSTNRNSYKCDFFPYNYFIKFDLKSNIYIYIYIHTYLFLIFTPDTISVMKYTKTQPTDLININICLLQDITVNDHRLSPLN